MIPLPAFLVAKPALKWGLMIGIPLIILGLIVWYLYDWGYDNGKADAEEACQAILAKQLNDMARQVVEAKQMESQVIRDRDERERSNNQQIEELRKKVADDAKRHKAMPLSRRLVDQYDELRRVSNAAAPRVSAPDSSPGKSEVSPGEVRTPAPQLVPVEGADGETVELTTDELKQAVIDGYDKLAGCKNDYAGFDRWNEGREILEIRRMGHE